MAELSLTLLGRPQIALAGQSVELTSQKAQALLFYLAMTGHTHSRQVLAGLLWSDMPESAARRNLRVELLKLRSHFADYLDVARDTIGLVKDGDYTLDVTRFERYLRGQEPTFTQLQEAVTLYRGEFLADFHIRDASLFEEWVTNERERLWQMARQAMLRLVNHYIQQQSYDQGIDIVNTLLKVEPWLEEAHQQLMRLLALSGQRSAALAHYETASAILYDEFGVPPADETNELYDQIERGELETGASLLLSRAVATPSAPPFQAPTAPLHFVGRSAELAQLQQQLATLAGQGIVALIGMAGVGKTTLAAHLAHTLHNDFPDGVLWAYIAGSDPLDILGSWAQALGYDFSSLSDVENRAAALRGVLADKQILIVLDDVRSAARVRSLLVGGGKSATLLTTRDLDVAAALNATPYTLAEMSLADGEQLLMRVLGEERVHAELTAARELCILLQNLPLAVEIAAQRLRSRPRRRIVDMAARLRNMQDRLDLAISDRAVRTSFMVSWESLDLEQQRIFALLGVFGGRSFGVPAVAAIADLERYPAEDLLFALTALSLLSEEEQEDGEVRYRQHPLLADFAREQLGITHEYYQRMSRYYLTFAQTYQTNYSALQPEWGNLMAGLHQAHTLSEWRLVLDYAAALTPPWFTRARYTEAREAYALAREAAEMLADQETLATCLLQWGRACIEQNDYAEAEDILDSARQIYHSVSDEVGIADVEFELARIALEISDFERAQNFLTTSNETYRMAADEQRIAATTYQLAFLRYRQGDLATTAQLCEQVLATQEQIGDQIGMLPTLRLMADTALEQDNFEIAEQYCLRALTLADQLQNRGALGPMYYMMTVVARCLGKLELAQSHAQQALELCLLTMDRALHALVLYELCRIHTLRGSFAEALKVGTESMALLRKLHDSFNLVYVLRQLGDLHQSNDDPAKARARWKEALALALTTQHPLKEQLQQRLASD